jgi:hypothetical protein
MSIISPLPYTIVNGSVIDANPVMADFNQIVNDVNSNAAALAGLSTQVFNVATATTSTEAVALAQLTALTPNLLVNGSAELGSLAWTLPSQAGYATGLSGEGTYFGISSAVNGTYVATSANYAVAPGVSLTLQAEIFASGLTAGDLVMDLEFLNASHTIIASNQSQSSVSADQTWTFTSASATTPANTAYWHARFYMASATITSGAFRKIKVSHSTVSSPYSREADFPLLNSGPRTVAGLPAGITGQRAFATDANAPAFLSAVAGGGAVVCPVFFNGSAWIVG